MQPIQHTIEQIIDALPHGSGIDVAWSVVTDSRHRKELACSYHAMNESGMYDGWIDFSVVLFQHTADKFNPLKGPCAGKTQVIHRRGDVDFRIVGQFSANRRQSTYGLKDYLAEIIGQSLHDAKITTSRHEIIETVEPAISSARFDRETRAMVAQGINPNDDDETDGGETEPDDCPESARPYGPHYTEPCNH